MMQSWVVYLGTLALCGVIAGFAERRESRIGVWIVIALLTAVAGLRKYTVGIDTAVYYTQFELIARGAMDQVYGLENSFRILCSVFLRLWNSSGGLMAAMSLITNVCIVWRLWDFRGIAPFRWMTACYYMGFYFTSLNCSRQFVAVAMVFYATRYLTREKPLGFLAGVAAASLFHQSAVVGFAYPVLELVNWNRMSDRGKKRHLAVLALMCVGLCFCGPVLQRYLRKITGLRLDVGLMLGAKLLFLMFSGFYLFVLKGPERYLPRWKTLGMEERKAVFLACGAWGIGVCMGMLGYGIQFGERISWYFGPFEGVHWGILLRSGDRLDRLVFGCCAVFLVGYGFLYSMLHNSQGTMPYLFFWQ